MTDENVEKQIEDLRKKIEALQKAVKDIKLTGFRESLLVYALQKAAQKYHKGGLIPLSHIKASLKGMEALMRYVFPK